MERIDSVRPSWDSYFLQVAKLIATRSTCRAFPVGAVIVKDKQIISSGYNGSPSGTSHCTTQGNCYPGVDSCDKSSLPSRAIHAETNAIAQAAKHGIPTAGSSIYVTLQPCLSCLKLLIASGVTTVYYEKTFDCKGGDVYNMFVDEDLIKLIQLKE